MFVLKIRHAPELSGAKCHAQLSHSKQLLEKYDVGTVLFTEEKDICNSHTEKPRRVTNPTQLQH